MTAARPRQWLDEDVELLRAVGERIWAAVERARAEVERSLSEEKLRLSEARLQAVLDGSPDPIFLKDRESRLLLANPATFAVIGKPAEACLGKTDEQFYDNPADGRAIMSNDRRILASGQAETVEETVNTPSGPRHYVSNKAPYRDAAGNIIGLIGTSRDITARKQAEDALRESEERLKRVLETDAVGVLFFDRDGTLSDANDVFLRMTGYSRQEVESGKLHWRAMTPPEWIAASEAQLEKFRLTGHVGPYEKEYFRKDGSRTWMLFAGRDMGDGAIVEFAIDISALKMAEEALRQSEDRYRRLVEQTTDWHLPRDSCASLYRRQSRRLRNAWHEREEVLASTFADVLAPGELERLPAAIAHMADGKVHYDEWRFRRKDGSVFVGELAGRRLSDGGFQGVLRDITARKEAEERMKLLLKEVNHRAKNMLALVQAVARQTAATGKDDFLTRFGERIQALAISQDLLVKAEWKGVQFDELVRSQLAHFQDLIGTRIELKGPPLLVAASAAQTFGMAIHELATNAGKYGALSAAEGRVMIAWSLERDGAGAETFALSWCEQGGPPVAPPSKSGFGSKVIGRLAESSLDANVDLEFRHTGLSWRLRCPAGGVIEGGSTFVQPARYDATEASRPKVLVVEDETLVAFEIAHVLRDAGFEVLGPVRFVAPALSLIEEHGCDAAVLDINLGAETSEPVARKLLSKGTPFITLSGYSRAQHPPAFDGAPALSKPLRSDLLITEIKRCLTGGGNRATKLPS